jgi:prephenate dehydratase
MKQATVAIQGQAGSYHHIASKDYFNESLQYIFSDTFKDVFLQVDGGNADYGIVAIENSLYGSINSVYDLLLKYKPWICGEIYLRIKHHLLGTNLASLNSIKQVHSQREAMAQCEAFLDSKLPQVTKFETQDTAGAAKYVAEMADPTIVAIASKDCTSLYGLKIMQSGIESNHHNYTRFIVIKNRSHENISLIDPSKSKTSIVLQLAERPGILHEALGSFASRQINLTKIESRPIVGKAWHYMFYVDFESSINSKSGKEALFELKKKGNKITILGTYEKGKQIA